jgi:hypothetical protein
VSAATSEQKAAMLAVLDRPGDQYVGRLELIGGYTDWEHIDRRPPLEVDQLRADRAALLHEWSQRGSW